MAQRPKLKVEKREILGKLVKKLRREGILPANIYGPDFKSTAVQVPFSDFNPIFEEVGETGLVDINFEGTTIPVLIHNVHTDFRRDVLHADFYKVNLKEKTNAMIPLEFIGEPKAVTDNIGLLEKVMSEVEVEALPTDLPEKIEVNVEPLAQIDEQITAGDLKLEEDVTLVTDPGQIVVKIGELVTKEAQEEAEAEAAAAEAAKTEGTEGEGAEGATSEEIQAEGGSEGEEEKPETPASE